MSRPGRDRGLALLTSLALVAGLLAAAPLLTAPADATTPPPLPYCRSDGGGNNLATSLTLNGHYQNSEFRIEPVFARRFYIDPGRGYDASYIGYRVSNRNATKQQSDVWLEVRGFGDGGALALVDPGEAQQRIGTLPKATSSTQGQTTTITPSAPTSRFLLVRALSETVEPQWHEVHVWSGRPHATGSSVLAACRTSIQSVQRSISANANKVTSITTEGTPIVGQTITVTVKGAPGKVGQGNDVDGSVMALTPATSAAWPARSLRLEAVALRVDGITNQAQSSCVASDPLGAVTTSRFGTGNNYSAIYSGTLILRGFGLCATRPSATYVATYTFRVISATATAPVIRPYADISSGTQIKYTGSLPAGTTTLPLDEATVDASATKTFVEIVAGAPSGSIDVRYRVTAGIEREPAPEVTTRLAFDAIEDVLVGAGSLQSVSVVDASGRTVDPSDVEVSTRKYDGLDATVHRFVGPFEATRTSSTHTQVVLEYVIRLALPTLGSDPVSYVNYAWALSGDQIIGTEAVVTGVALSVKDDGTTTATAAPVQPLELRSQRILFDPIGTLGAGVSVPLVATTDSGLPVTFTVTVDPDEDPVCEVLQFDGTWTLRTLAPGSCEVVASADGDGTFGPAAPVARPVEVLAGQFITGSAGAFASGTSEVTLSATSKLEVLLRSLDTEVCTVAAAATSYDPSTGVTIYEVTAGDATGACLLVASQPGDAQWGPAPELDLTVGVGSLQLLSFITPDPDVPADLAVELESVGGTFLPKTRTVSGTTDANPKISTAAKRLPLQFRSLTPGVCTVTQPTPIDGEIQTGLNTSTGVTSWTYTLTAPGTCTLMAEQDGFDNAGDPSGYAFATPITVSITVASDATTDQFLFLDGRDDFEYGTLATFTVSATSRLADVEDAAPTGLAVVFGGTPGVCTVGSSTLLSGVTTASVQVLAGGDCIIRAEQPGDTTYRAASQQQTTVRITPRTVNVVGLSGVDRFYDGTTVVTLAGSPSLAGVVPGDGPTQVRIEGTPQGALSSPSAGDGRTVTVSGLTLDGTKVGAAASYVLSSDPITVTANIAKRPVDILGLTVDSRPYDGTTSISVAGTPVPSGTDGDRGRLDVDEDDLAIVGNPTGTLDGSDAGPRTVTVGGLSLDGSAAANYLLAGLTLEVDITPRPVTITVDDAVAVAVDDADPIACTASASGLADGDVLSDGYECIASRSGGASEGTVAISGTVGLFRSGTDPLLDVTDNYSVTLVAGVLTISDKALPQLDFSVIARDQTFVYGTDIAHLLNIPVTTTGSASVAGTLTHTKAAVAVTGATLLEVGSHSLTVTFVPDAPEDFETVVLTRTFTVTARPVEVTGLSVLDRVYDATTTVALAGTPLLADASGATGILGSDRDTEGAIELQGTAVGTAASPDVGTRAVTVSGLTLGGTRAPNYLLVAPSVSDVTISARRLVVTADPVVIAPGDPAPACTVTAAVAAGEGLVGADAIDTAACDFLDAVGGTAPSELAAGATPVLVPASIALNPGTLGNYTIEFVEATVTVAKLDPVISAEVVEIVYGDSLAGELDVWTTSSPRGGTVAGEFSRSWVRDGATFAIDMGERLAAGDYTIRLAFIPDQGNRYGSVAGVDRTVRVLPRPVTVTPQTLFKLVGMPDPTFTVTRSGFLAGDESLPLTDPIVVGRAAGQDGEAIGRYSIVGSGGALPNYTFVHETAEIVVGAVSVDVPGSGELERDQVLACTCEGLVEGMEVTVTLFSDPVVLGTALVDADGSCPELAALDPVPSADVLPDGDHTLVVSIAENGTGVLGGGAPLELSAPVALLGSGSGSRSVVDPEDPTPPVNGTGTPPPTPPGTPNGAADPVPPAGTPPAGTPPAGTTLAGPSGPVTRGPVVPTVRDADVVPSEGAGGRPGGGGSTGTDVVRPGPGTGAQPPAAGGRITLDVGAGRPGVTIDPGAPLASLLAEVRSAVTVRLDALAGESLSGFAPGTAARVEVIGARSGARFVLTDLGAVDGAVLVVALERSMAVQATDFARIEGVRVVGAPRSIGTAAWSDEQRVQVDDLFAASRLPRPRSLAEVDLSGVRTWVEVTGRVDGYLPGSTVHLTATSDPIVLASTTVDRHGTALVSGLLPVEVLGLGEHRLRLVGTRVFDGVDVDGDGEIRLSADVLAEIDRFDRGTDATVVVYGLNGSGGSHVSLRIVPLDPVPPWWTLLVVGLVGLLVLRARRVGRVNGGRRIGAAVSVVLVSAAPAVVLGWLATTTVVAVVGLVAAVVLAALVPVLRPEDDASEVDADTSVGAGRGRAAGASGAAVIAAILAVPMLGQEPPPLIDPVGAEQPRLESEGLGLELADFDRLQARLDEQRRLLG